MRQAEKMRYVDRNANTKNNKVAGRMQDLRVRLPVEAS
jgi:hypothetical protein